MQAKLQDDRGAKAGPSDAPPVSFEDSAWPHPELRKLFPSSAAAGGSANYQEGDLRRDGKASMGTAQGKSAGGFAGGSADYQEGELRRKDGKASMGTAQGKSAGGSRKKGDILKDGGVATGRWPGVAANQRGRCNGRAGFCTAFGRLGDRHRVWVRVNGSRSYVHCGYYLSPCNEAP
jgi:hypothetical protein